MKYTSVGGYLSPLPIARTSSKRKKVSTDAITSEVSKCILNTTASFFSMNTYSSCPALSRTAVITYIAKRQTTYPARSATDTPSQGTAISEFRSKRTMKRREKTVPPRPSIPRNSFWREGRGRCLPSRCA